MRPAARFRFRRRFVTRAIRLSAGEVVEDLYGLSLGDLADVPVPFDHPHRRGCAPPHDAGYHGEHQDTRRNRPELP